MKNVSTFAFPCSVKNVGKDEVPVRALKACGGVEVLLNTFITSVSDRAFNYIPWLLCFQVKSPS